MISRPDMLAVEYDRWMVEKDDLEDWMRFEFDEQDKLAEMAPFPAWPGGNL